LSFSCFAENVAFLYVWVTEVSVAELDSSAQNESNIPVRSRANEIDSLKIPLLREVVLPTVIGPRFHRGDLAEADD
jgi:hypothetical protein